MTAGADRASASRRALAVGCAIALASLWMRTGFPTVAFGGAGFDDALFIRAARFLGAGAWLGPYDFLTLAKGMFYPLFILVCFAASIPLMIGEQLAYLAACGAVAAIVARATGHRLGLLLFAALAFNPVLWTVEMSRVIREGLYISQTLACVGLAVAVAFPVGRERRRWALGAALGCVLGAFWLTREEGPWLLPALAVVPLVALAAPKTDGLSRRSRTARMAGPFALGAAVTMAMLLSVAAMNWREYGVFLTTEFQGGSFPRAYGALARVRSDHWQRYLVFPADARARTYAVSPAAAELAPTLDGAIGTIWAGNGCRATGLEPCPGILSGWFMWALRDAANAAGHMGTAIETQRYFSRVANEVNRACRIGRLACGPPDRGLAPPFRWSYLRPAALSALRIARIMVTFDVNLAGSAPSVGAPYDVSVFRDVAGPVMPLLSGRMVVTGWVADAAATPRLRVVGPDGHPSYTLLTEAPAADLTTLVPGLYAERFQLETMCDAGCQLVVIGDGGVQPRLPITSLKTGLMLPGPGPRLNIEIASVRNPGAAGERLRAVHVRIARVLERVYGAVLPPAIALAALGLALTLVPGRSRAAPPRVVAFMLAGLVAIVSRLLLLAYLDATSIPSANALYASPVSPLVIGFAVAGCWLGWMRLRRVWINRSESIHPAPRIAAK